MFCFQAAGNCRPHEKCSFLYPFPLIKASQSLSLVCGPAFTLHCTNSEMWGYLPERSLWATMCILRSFPQTARRDTPSQECWIHISWAQVLDFSVSVPNKLINGEPFLVALCQSQVTQGKHRVYQKPIGKVSLPFAAWQEEGRRSAANLFPVAQKVVWFISWIKL